MILLVKIGGVNMNWNELFEIEPESELEGFDTEMAMESLTGELPTRKGQKIPRAYPGKRPSAKFPFRKIPPRLRFPFAPWGGITVIRDRNGNEPPSKPDKPSQEPGSSGSSSASGGAPANPDDAAPEGNEYVRWVQSTLNQVLGLRLPLDGVLGPETRSALRSFQQKQGLPADGIVGPETERLLMGASRRDQTGGSSSEFEAFDTELADEWQSEVNRSSSTYIKWIQQSLNQLMGLRLAVDGISGTQTRSAIRSFQQQHGLVVDGIVGPQTEQALITAGAGYPPGGGSPTYVPPSSQPSTSSRVLLAQQILDHDHILLWPHSPISSNSSDGADAHSNVSDTADGGAASRSNYTNAPGGSVNLDPRMLDGMLKLANTYDMRITAIAGGSHSSNSRHYAGIAFDIDEINGVHVTKSNPYYRNLMQKCRDLGATEVFGPGDKDHDTHVHCAWPRP